MATPYSIEPQQRQEMNSLADEVLSMEHADVTTVPVAALRLAQLVKAVTAGGWQGGKVTVVE